MEAGEKVAEMRRILTEEVADDNYFILKYVIHFLTEVFTTIIVGFIFLNFLSCVTEIFSVHCFEFFRSRSSLVKLLELASTTAVTHICGVRKRIWPKLLPYSPTEPS